jgi:hypothetical protein
LPPLPGLVPPWLQSAGPLLLGHSFAGCRGASFRNSLGGRSYSVATRRPSCRR